MQQLSDTPAPRPLVVLTRATSCARLRSRTANGTLYGMSFLVGRSTRDGAGRWRLCAALGAVAAASVLVGGSAAYGQSGDRQVYEGTLTSQQPGTATGLRQHIRYVDPSEPGGKPPAVAEVVFRLPPGTRIDTSVPGRCAASELEFQLRGADACPLDSRVGDGALSADTGVQAGVYPRVIETAVTFFNNRDELILFAESTNTPGPPVRVASRIEVRDGTLVSRVPPLPAAPPPDPFLALREVVNHLEEVVSPAEGGQRGAYLTTPKTCPASGYWTITAVFTYRDGVTQTEESQTPCTAASARAPAAGQQRPDARAQADKRRRPVGERRKFASGAVAPSPIGAVETGTGGAAAGLLLDSWLPGW